MAGKSLIEKLNDVESWVVRAQAEIERLRGVLLSKHGGEPLALLHELDEAKHRNEELEDKIDRLREEVYKRGDIISEQSVEKDKLRDRIEDLQTIFDFISDAMWGGERGWSVDLEVFKNEAARRLSGGKAIGGEDE